MRRLILLALLTLPASALAESAPYKGISVSDASGQYKMAIKGRFQLRYTLDAPEDDDDGNSQHFAMQRVRLKLAGTAHSPKLGYALQLDAGKGAVSLKDAYATYAFQKKAFILKAGQFKKAYSRQQLTSSGKLALADRSIADGALPSGRDIGLEVGSARKGRVVEWQLGVFNGTGDKASFQPKTDSNGAVTGGKFSNVPADFSPAAVLRAAYNHGKMKGYSQADLEGGDLRFSVGANAHLDLALTDDAKDPTWVAGVDAAVKVHGLSAQLEFHRDDEKEANIYFAQAGYVLADRFQPVVHFATVDADPLTQREITGGLSVYFFGHNLKWTTDVSQIHTDLDGATADDMRVRSQLQLAL